jgi:ribonuclease J
MVKFQSHCSGHARGRDLLDAVKEINAKTLYPVHTEHAELYQNITMNMISIQEGKKYTL